MIKLCNFPIQIIKISVEVDLQTCHFQNLDPTYDNMTYYDYYGLLAKKTTSLINIITTS